MPYDAKIILSPDWLAAPVSAVGPAIKVGNWVDLGDGSYQQVVRFEPSPQASVEIVGIEP
jgi:hypothetical protein